MMYTFPNFKQAHFSLSGSNSCILTCKQISQEAGKLGWYPISLRIFHSLFHPHSKGFSIVNKAEVHVFCNSLAFSMIQQLLAI